MSTTLKPSKPSTTTGAGVPTVWLDGKWYDRETATVSVYDHGLLYGDGVFEGIRVYGGKIFKLSEHLDRLYDSAKAIWLTIPMPKDEMAAVTEEAVRRSGIAEAYIRHVITRGVGDLGLDPRKCPKPSIIIIVDTIRLFPEEVYETGLRVVTAGTPIPHREALSPRVKSLNYLPHILAKIEGIHSGADEVLMLDSEGHVAEGSGQASESGTSAKPARSILPMAAPISTGLQARRCSTPVSRSPNSQTRPAGAGSTRRPPGARSRTAQR